MPFIEETLNSPAPRHRALRVGPLIEPQRRWIRYGSAVGLLLTVALARFALVPLLGSQAPLLPFIVAVLVTAYIGGRGPALLVCLLAPPVATVLFTHWPKDSNPGAWDAHLAFFVAVSVIATLIVDQLQRSYAAQQESERLLKLIYDGSSDAIYLAQLEPPDRFRFVSVNKTFLTVSGYSREQVEGRLMEDIVPAASHALVRSKYREAIESRGPVIFQEVADLPAGRKHGEITLMPIVGRDDSVTHILAAIKDITAQEHAIAVARLANQESARLGVLKEEFLTTVNHELRTPLHAILTWTNLLRRGDLPAADVQRGLESIERNARLQTLTVSDLLDTSGIMSGKLRLKMSPLDVRTALTAAVEAARPAALAKSIELLESLDGSPGLVMGDPDRLQQVFWNLLSNAVKFTDRGGRVQVTLQQLDSQIRISFEDSGQGIAAEFLPHVFDRFRQADGSLSRMYGGMGLGLAIVRGVVEMHGGSVEATSPGPGRGATFRVSFPVTTHIGAPLEPAQLSSSASGA